MTDNAVNLSKLLQRRKQSELYRFKACQIEEIKAVRHEGLPVPLPRSGHRCIANDSNMYSFGGFNPSERITDDAQDENETEGPLFRELWKFNFVTKFWTKIKTRGFMPKELASHCALLSGQSMLVYGGTGVPFGDTSSNTLHVCDLKSMKWHTIKTTGDPPEKLYGQAMALVNKHLYVYGGTTGFDYSSDVFQLNMTNLHWEELATNNKPHERYRHEIAADDKCLYVFGGGTSLVCFSFSKLPVFNIKQRQWSTLTTFPDDTKRLRDLGLTEPGYPTPRRCHSLVQKDEYVYICGGYDGTIIYADIWRFSLINHQWLRLECKLPTPVYFHSSALTPSGCMYIFGGVTRIIENTRTSDVYAVWLQVPSLRDMCWQALTHYVPQMQTISRDSWQKIGVPLDLVDRIDYSPVAAR